MFCVMCSSGVHDIGGLEEEFGPIDTREYGYQLWEMQVHTFTRMLILARAVGVPVGPAIKFQPYHILSRNLAIE